jgi:hypothetical protein
MDWKDLRQEPSSDPRTVQERRRQWLIAAQETAHADHAESVRNAEATIEAAKETAAAVALLELGATKEMEAALALLELSEGRETEKIWLTSPPVFDEQLDKSKPALMLRYNIIDIITINNIEDNNVYNCNLLTQAIFAILDTAYVNLDLKKNGGNIPVGWEYIYIVCELILNTEYYVALIDNKVFDNGLFMYFYNSMYEYLSSSIIHIRTDNTDMYILGIIDHFNKLFTAIEHGGQIKYEFIKKIAYHLPISFLFTNPVEVEFPMLLKDIIILRPLIPRCLQSSNTELMSCINASRSHIEGQLLNTQCLQNYNQNKEYCDQGIASIAGGSYNNNIIKKLKIKKRATKRRQHKSQIFKKLKKHKSQKQKIQRKYKSKKPRKHKLIFSKTFKKKI